MISLRGKKFSREIWRDVFSTRKKILFVVTESPVRVFFRGRGERLGLAFRGDRVLSTVMEDFRRPNVGATMYITNADAPSRN